MARPKRRAAQAFPEEEEAEASQVNEHTSPVIDEEKAEAIWSVVREEYHETVEQLPLSFQRLFVLIKEFETQSSEYMDELKQLMHAYIRQRKAMTQAQLNSHHDPPVDLPVAMDHTSTVVNIGEEAAAGKEEHIPDVAQPLTVLPEPITELHATSNNPLLRPDALPALILGRIAVLTSSILTAADERLNSAESALHSIDHHIALVDQGIKDTETSLALGTRPGTHPGSLVLPAIVAPSVRPQKALKALPPSEPVAEPKKLKLTIRKPAAVQEEITTTDERNYCYCNQPSYGEMIGCDNEVDCKREWFHIGCTELKKAPPGKWFCRDCKTARRLAPRRK